MDVIKMVEVNAGNVKHLGNSAS